MKSLLKAHYSFKRKLEQGLRKYGFNSATGKIILYISENEGCQQNDIARDCFVTTSSLSSVLKKWKTTVGLQDNIHMITDVHIQYIPPVRVKRYSKQFDNTIDNAFEGFSQKKASELRAYLDRVVRNLNK